MIYRILIGILGVILLFLVVISFKEKSEGTFKYLIVVFLILVLLIYKYKRIK